MIKNVSFPITSPAERSPPGSSRWLPGCSHTRLVLGDGFLNQGMRVANNQDIIFYIQKDKYIIIIYYNYIYIVIMYNGWVVIGISLNILYTYHISLRILSQRISTRPRPIKPSRCPVAVQPFGRAGRFSLERPWIWDRSSFTSNMFWKSLENQPVAKLHDFGKKDGDISWHRHVLV